MVAGLLDNDFLFKFVACDLIEPALELLGLTRANIRVLESLPFVARKSKSVKKNYNEDTLARSIAYAEGIAKVMPNLESEAYKRLSQIEGIDQGEATLFARALDEGGVILATGDKRALKALATAPNIDDLHTRLKSRIVCIEQVMGALAERDFEHVRRCVVPVYDCDKVLRSAFGSGLKSTKEAVLEALAHYHRQVAAASNGLVYIEYEFVEAVTSLAAEPKK